MLAGNSRLPVCRGLLSDRGIDCLGLQRYQHRQYKSCCGGNQKCATESQACFRDTQAKILHQPSYLSLRIPDRGERDNGGFRT